MNCLRFFQIAVCLLCILLLSACTRSLSRFIARQSNPKCGVAILEGFDRPAKGSPIPSYTLITNEGDRFEHKLCLITPSEYCTNRFVGCKYLCWYDADNPRKSSIYPCLDSMVFDHPSVYQGNGYIKSVKKKQNLTYVCYDFRSKENVEFEWKEYIPSEYYEKCKAVCKAHSCILIDFFYNPSDTVYLIPQINREYLSHINPIKTF